MPITVSNSKVMPWNVFISVFFFVFFPPLLLSKSYEKSQDLSEWICDPGLRLTETERARWINNENKCYLLILFLLLLEARDFFNTSPTGLHTFHNFVTAREGNHYLVFLGSAALDCVCSLTVFFVYFGAGRFSGREVKCVCVLKMMLEGNIHTHVQIHPHH